jgi:hypothetical protein
MKHLFSAVCFTVLSTFLYAQAPELFNYQGVARDNSGNVLANQAIGLRITLHSGSPGGTTVYSETHAVTTNTFGLFAVEIGGGSVLSGTIAAINWGGNSYYVQTEMDASGGTSYTNMGTAQLLSVPYALYSKSSGTSGPQGATGSTGATGATGTNGAPGATGATGNNGTAGATGATGATGNAGATGANGNDGSSVVIQGSVATSANLPPTGNTQGDGYITQNTGHLWVWDGSAWVDAGLIQGPAGATGVTGATGGVGSAGATGATGATGNNGSAGATGATGATGNNGSAGATGATGATGNNGSAGATGATGATGNNGSAGATGATGATGNNGSAGATGATGATGNNGSAGATGATGATGNNGSAGATGATGATGIGTGSLDMAYDYSGAGLGRTITADAGAVKIAGADGLLITGDFGIGAVPEITGSGTRMFFNPNKAAFRAGYISGSGWDHVFIGNYSVAMGYNTIASGNQSTAFGDGTYSTNTASTAMGKGTTASGEYSTALGYNSRAFGAASTAIGVSNDATGIYSIAMGQSTQATGSNSTSMGLNTIASGNYSTAMGESTQASGINSTSMGYNTQASGTLSTALGNGSNATNAAATAMGQYTTASGSVSTAMGYVSQAEGLVSTAMGYSTDASGDYSTAIGFQSTSSGLGSFAIGVFAEASGDGATVMGEYTTARSFYETTIGRYNTDYTPASAIAWNTADRLFVIGNGTAGNATSNAMVVLKNGNTGIGSSIPGEKLDVDGTIKLSGNISSPKFRATQVWSQNSNLPAPTAFQSGGGTLIIMVSGSGHTAPAGVIGIDVKLNGNTIGQCKVLTNEIDSHKAFTNNYIVVTGIAAGTQTLSLTAISGTNIDLNDFFSATVMEMPY